MSGAPYLVRDVEETLELDLARAEGSLLFDKQGKRYINFAAGLTLTRSPDDPSIYL